MNVFSHISAQENKELLKFPAYISLLAANSDDSLDETEKKSAIKFSHTKTFSCDPHLTEFYKQADSEFASNIEHLDNALPKGKENRDLVIKNELVNLEKIAHKLGNPLTDIMDRSMESFKKHVAKAHHNVLIDFVFPIPIPGLSERLNQAIN